MKNYAYIDGQNLHLGTVSENWQIDFKKFRRYLKEKYSVKEAFYFLGYYSKKEQDLYNNLRKAGFSLVFKEHSDKLKCDKKGNVDSDIIFEILICSFKNKNCDKFVLVSGDGDYVKLINYLIEEDKLEKILFPNKKFASSLYKRFSHTYFDYLQNFRGNIEYKNKNKKKGA